MKRALFFVYLDTHFIELRRVADLLRGAGGWQCVFLFAYRYPTAARDIDWCRQQGFECIDSAGRALGAEPAPAQAAPSPPLPPSPAFATVRRLVPRPLRRFLRSVLTAIQNLAPRAVLARNFPNLELYLRHYAEQIALAERVIAAASPHILVLPEDNVEYATGLLIRAAKKRGIASVIVPYTMANAEEIAEAYWHNPDFFPKRWQDRVVLFLFPRWVHWHRGRELLRLPIDNIVAIELLRLSPPLPWILNSGGVDAIAVESPFMHDYYHAAGLPRAKLVVTGALYDDVVHQQMAAHGGRAAELRARLGIAAARPVLLCALPPDQYRSGRPGAEFASYEEMVRAWAEALVGAEGYQVLIRLHPRTVRSEVAFLEQEYRLPIVAEDTASLIPLCDVYVASVSATIRLAVACGKPVINYDCYRFRYSDFRAVPGVVSVEHLAAFRAQLARFADPAERTAFGEKQKAFAAQANIIDGRCGERMLALFIQLTARPS